MNNIPNTEGPTAEETLRGGLEITLQLLDGSRCTVWVRQVPLGEMAELLSAQGDEAKLAEVYCQAPGRANIVMSADWFSRINPESQERVIMEGDRINADFFGRWFRRRLARQERLVPGSTARIMEAFNPEADSSNSLPARVVPAG